MPTHLPSRVILVLGIALGPRWINANGLAWEKHLPLGTLSLHAARLASSACWAVCADAMPVLERRACTRYPKASDQPKSETPVPPCNRVLACCGCSSALGRSIGNYLQFLKGDGDRNQCEDYGPILLLAVGYNFFASILFRCSDPKRVPPHVEVVAVCCFRRQTQAKRVLESRCRAGVPM